VKLSVQAQFDTFLNALYKDSHLKNRLIVWTFAGLVLPTAFLVAAGVPEKPACIIMTALAPPLLIAVYALTSLRKTKSVRSGDPLPMVYQEPRVFPETITVEIKVSESLKEISARITLIVADTVLLAIWLIGEYCLERYLVPAFHETSTIAAAFLWVFRLTFAVSTLGPWVFFLYRHLLIFWIQTQIRIKHIKGTFSEQKSTQRI
jgi:hypothetical protein